MDLRQELQLLSQMSVAAHLGTCHSTNTRDLKKAYGDEASKNAETLYFPNPKNKLSFWENMPERDHHSHIHCRIKNFKDHQISMGLLAQERDSFIQRKMQNHLRALRTQYKSKALSPHENEKYECVVHSLFLSSRQKFVRDNFYNSYVSICSGKKLKPNDLRSIVRVPTLTQMEKKKGYVIRGISYNDFLWPKGKEFTPTSPFTILPRHVIRNRQKDNPDTNIQATLPNVMGILSQSSSLAIANHAIHFYGSMRSKYHKMRQVNRYLQTRLAQIQDQTIQFALESQVGDIDSIFSSDDVFRQYWPISKPTNQIKPCSKPNTVSVDLYAHQYIGLSWLVHQYDNHLNALLADDTGLGKTLQIISFLAYLKERRHINGPHLIVVPNAVMVTWKTEFEKYMPSAKLIYYYAKMTQRHNYYHNVVSRCEFDVLLTTYSMLENDKDLLSTITWRVIVFDEGHKLKNSKTNIFKTVDSSFFSNFRIVVTATPFQNNISELWSLLSILSPNEFSSIDKFRHFFSLLEAKSSDEDTKNLVVTRLHELIRPFTLRRRQDEINIEIPIKCEVTLRLDPSRLQEQLLEIKELACDVSQKIFAIKRLSNSPILFLERSRLKSINPEYVLSRSPKMQMLDKILSKLVLLGHKFLIFSQWTSMMDIIESYVLWKRIETLRIDGSVSYNERKQIISSFNQPDSTIKGLLLSTRSSSLGLNLQVADTVILFDSDYNPFVELQASARVHRLGQKNPVVVIRLLTQKTGEESILKIARKKFILGQQIINAGLFNLSETDVDKQREIMSYTNDNRVIPNPTEEIVNDIIARGNDESGILSFAPQHESIEYIDNEQTQDIDEEILEIYKKFINSKTEIEVFEDIED